MKHSNLIIILSKNPVLGSAKTRLASSVGDEKALEIYNFLLQHTASICSVVDSDRIVHYTSHVEQNDVFSKDYFMKTIQVSGDLGDRMAAAFEQAFQGHYERVVIIGSDCYELSSDILEQAFGALESKDFVLGPAKDGGYYLLGMRQLESAVFRNKAWSTEGLYQNTLLDLKTLGYTYSELPVLSDVDYLEDLPQAVRDKFGV